MVNKVARISQGNEIAEFNMGLFDGTPLEQVVTCTTCGALSKECVCPEVDESQQPLQLDKQRVQLRTEKRARGKLVTVVAGLNGRHEQLLQVLKNLKEVCGSGGSVAETHLELQGDHVARLRKWLAAQGAKVLAK